MNPTSLIGHVLELLNSLEGATQPIDQIVGTFFRNRRYLGSRDRRFISETTYGIVRHRRYCEALLEEFLEQHPASESIDESGKRFLPLYVVYANAVIDDRGENVLEGIRSPSTVWKTYFTDVDLSSFAEWINKNASLQFLSSAEPDVQLGVKYSFQDWMVNTLKETAGNEIEELLQALNEPAPIVLRANRLKCSREDCESRLRKEGVEVDPTKYSPAGLIARKRFNTHASPAFNDGWYEIQDEGSQLVSVIANPQRRSVVIDGCAGAGGKTLHLGALMHNEGEIIAIDTDAKRLYELQHRAARGGIHNVRTQLRENLILGNLQGKADLVLVDAPCTGVGTIRRNPQFKWTVTESLVEHYHERQLSILQFNSQFVKPAGKLVYVTCSMLKRENEDVISEFLSLHGEFNVIVPQAELERLGFNVEGEFVRLFPHRHKTDGFFIAMMERMK